MSLCHLHDSYCVDTLLITTGIVCYSLIVNHQKLVDHNKLVLYAADLSITGCFCKSHSPTHPDGLLIVLMDSMTRM